LLRVAQSFSVGTDASTKFSALPLAHASAYNSFPNYTSL